MISTANQWTGFYMIGTSVMKEVRTSDVSIQILVLSTFLTNQGVTILKKHKNEPNWYLTFTTPIHHKSAMLISYIIQHICELNINVHLGAVVISARRYFSISKCF